ncbi:TPA: SAM-dependent methyltransferase [Patescibacteria group bacterium]|uniref:N6 adenine-specific DNA methyltransferase n=1 Tax=Candidatus Gottesmanbacteria bacterium GW2011_GWA1_43_11 TaxID=1618436 RepID=A0A0G1F9V1_9BACT|nr:MAG: N6 adenine-specific DNA methyltransferase [Candidatus Gottesmanbacteria bacterium GW2011_GWA1_43_11]HCS78999.1 SAM-dependent methyltransferase [Patescibacteria group bacterium]
MNFKINESEQKLRGGYYTPLDLAVFLTKWVRNINPRTVLEPSCGDGVFFEAIDKVNGMKGVSVLGLEINENEAQKAQLRAKGTSANIEVQTEDFLKWSLDNIRNNKSLYDAVVGNPPFIRYQYLPKEFQQRSEEIFNELNLPFTKHTNAWVPFVLASLAMLRPGGRLAMVVPAEIIHIIHAQSLRTYLGKECKRLVIVDPEELWFKDTLQGAVLLLAEKRNNTYENAEGVGIYPVKQKEFLDIDPDIIFSSPKSLNGRTVAGKWTYALLDHSTRNLIDSLIDHPDVYHFNDVADVDVGIVTGANDYFLVSDETVQEYNLSKWAHPMFGRSEHCPGIIYDEQQHQENKKNGKPTNFIWFSNKPTDSAIAKKYIHYGEEQGLHLRYKCSVRSPWYSVPSVYATEIGMLKRSHDIPRLIFNKIGAFTTDTAYRIRVHNRSSRQLVGSFLNSLTALSAELEGRHYGGGVLELVPSEIEKLLIPLSKKLTVNLANLDTAIKTLPARELLAKQDSTILNALGLNLSDQNQLLNNWQKLHDRRQRTSSDAETN